MAQFQPSNAQPAQLVSPFRQAIPDLPVVVWLVVCALAAGFAGQLSAADVILGFNDGFGRALGEFALILLPSFVLAATFSRADVSSPEIGKVSAGASPIAGAGMICPDTAYAALAPIAGERKMHVAFGAYSGFKLLYPAGPLLVATGLGVMGPDGLGAELALYGIALLLPVWAVGLAWTRLFGRVQTGQVAARAYVTQDTGAGHIIQAFLPFILLAALLILGGAIGHTGVAILDFLFHPKGALIAAALLALSKTPRNERRGCWDSAVRRTGSLLLVIGAASAFGAMLTQLVPVQDLLPTGQGMLVLVGLFALTAAFKVVQGSSMATFAAVAPVAAPIVAASDVNSIAAVYAICLGSFIAVLPNDSYYWLVRRDLTEQAPEKSGAIWVLSSGVTAQALIGLGLVLSAVWIWA